MTQGKLLKIYVHMERTHFIKLLFKNLGVKESRLRREEKGKMNFFLFL